MMLLSFFFFNDTATTEIYTLSLHDALPISRLRIEQKDGGVVAHISCLRMCPPFPGLPASDLRVGSAGLSGASALPSLIVAFRSEEHTSELQSRQYLVCRLLLEKKKTKRYTL